MTTIPDDMVERVARAIADKMHAGGDFGMTGADAYRRRSAEFMSMARAAIEAMQPSILDDIMRVADNIANERFALGLRVENVQELSDAIANAILAERERCAKVADEFAADYREHISKFPNDREQRRLAHLHGLLAFSIAAAIRKGSE